MPVEFRGERAKDRAEMVRQIEREALQTAQYTGRSAFAPAVMQAMATVPRHKFVPMGEEPVAYVDGPLPIGHGQTISQPYIVALMTDLAEINDESIVLEVGSGSGYQAAVLAEIAREVYSVELIPVLAETARERLQDQGYTNVAIRIGDGYEGWQEHAPFDAIVVTAAAHDVPPPLVAQLKPGGRLVIPVDRTWFGQELILITKSADGEVAQRDILPVSFVPLRRQAHSA